MVQILGGIGAAYEALGDYAKALETLERAFVAEESLGEAAAAAATLGNIGSVQHALGDDAKALSTLERALE